MGMRDKLIPQRLYHTARECPFCGSFELRSINLGGGYLNERKKEYPKQIYECLCCHKEIHNPTIIKWEYSQDEYGMLVDSITNEIAKLNIHHDFYRVLAGRQKHNEIKNK